MGKIGKQLIQSYKETKKSSILVYLILRALVIFCMIRQILRGDLNRSIFMYIIFNTIYNTRTN